METLNPHNDAATWLAKLRVYLEPGESRIALARAEINADLSRRMNLSSPLDFFNDRAASQRLALWVALNGSLNDRFMQILADRYAPLSEATPEQIALAVCDLFGLKV